jgi:hypothetical protein
MTDSRDSDISVADQNQAKGKTPKKTGQKVSSSNNALDCSALEIIWRFFNAIS